jgi:ELWxxDGT repeat protein
MSAYLVKDLNTNTQSSFPSNLTNVNGTLFFSADDNAHMIGLWRSDGTAAGTTLVKEIFQDSVFTQIYDFTNVTGTLFFATRDQARMTELWKSDGTSDGTVVVKEFWNGHHRIPQWLTVRH